MRNFLYRGVITEDNIVQLHFMNYFYISHIIF